MTEKIQNLFQLALNNKAVKKMIVKTNGRMVKTTVV